MTHEPEPSSQTSHPPCEVLLDFEEGDDGAAGPTATLPSAVALPAVEEEALTTRRVEATHLAVAVGLDAEALQICCGTLGDRIQIVVAHDVAVACYLLAALRAHLVIAPSSLTDMAGTRLAAAAASCRAQLVCLGPGASSVAVGWRLQRAAAIAFGSALLRAPATALLDCPAPAREQS